MKEENKYMEEKMFIKEKKSMPQGLMVLIVALIGGVIGSVLTYLVVDEKLLNGTTDTSSESTTNVKYEITETDSPVVAIAAKAGPSIVGVKVTYTTQSFFGTEEADEEGSGIVYSEDGYIITNYHVIESAINNTTAVVEVSLPNTDESYEAKIIGGDETTDLAVIKIDKTGLTKADFGESSELQVGELAVAIGNPLGEELAGSVTVGYISALNRQITADGRTYNLVQTDAAINPGNSGGALVNSKGEVIGINTVKISVTGVEGLGFAIPIDDALPIIKELIENGKIVRPYIGVSGVDLDETTAKRNNLVEGIYIAQVLNGSPAKEAGLQKGDVIVKFEGEEVKTMEELNKQKNTKNIGDTVTITVNRNGKEIDVKLKLASDDIDTSTSVTN
jgi:serine protease Do